jgi:predicted enzyme related to lactoylglutathione lyase
MKVLQTFSRLYVNDLNSSLEFYEELLGTPAAMRFEIPQIGLELAQIGNILLIAGSEEALKPFRSTQATFLVDSLDDFRVFLEKKGAEIIRGPNKVPTGRNMTIRHPDGSVIEYVEHSKAPEKKLEEQNKKKQKEYPDMLEKLKGLMPEAII